MNRLFSLESKVDSQKIRTGSLEDEDWAKLIEGAGVIGNSRLIIDDTPGISILSFGPNAENSNWNRDWILLSLTTYS